MNDVSPKSRLRRPRSLSAPPTAAPQSHEVTPAPGCRLDRYKRVAWAAGVVIAAQLLLPSELKPFQLAGEAAAQFHGALFDEVNRKELELAQQQEIARRMAQLQADYADWKGMCAMTAAFDRELGQLCMLGAENFYQEALKQIRKSELIYR
ncbi:MAG: hypothetical protein Kilf2KO_34820 [Rhodospirillales bacterium]